MSRTTTQRDLRNDSGEIVHRLDEGETFVLTHGCPEDGPVDVEEAALLIFDVVFEEGGRHTVVRFDGYKVTVLPRHNEINEYTARGAIRDAEQWEKGRR